MTSKRACTKRTLPPDVPDNPKPASPRTLGADIAERLRCVCGHFLDAHTVNYGNPHACCSECLICTEYRYQHPRDCACPDCKRKDRSA